MPEPVNKEMCATCPWRDGSPYSALIPTLSRSALKQASRICHSTGRNAIKRTKLPGRLCRGARDLQLQYFTAIGFIDAPTDEAWEAKVQELGLGK